jgi:hypothetical protein
MPAYALVEGGCLSQRTAAITPTSHLKYGIIIGATTSHVSESVGNIASYWLVHKSTARDTSLI